MAVGQLFKMKKYLILINNAFKMGHYHVALGNELKRAGNDVIYAFVDKLPFYIEKLDIGDAKYYVFAEYFKAHYNENEFDSKYLSINVNKLFFSDYDRCLVYEGLKFKGNDYYKRLMCNLINFFDSIYKEDKIDFCLYESISNSFAYTAYEVLRKNGTQYCGYAGCRLKGHFELYTEKFGSRDYFKEIYNQINESDIPSHKLIEIDNYLSMYGEKEMPSYHPRKTSLDWNFSLFKRYFNLDKLLVLKGAFVYLVKEHQYIKYSYQSQNPLTGIFKGFSKQVRKIYTVRASRKYFDKPQLDEKYFLYPQHFKPEASTSVLARHYCSDLSVIENIAFNLPFGSYLYVKEHFVNFGRLPLEHYRKLKKIPNVRLIACDTNTKELIEKSLGVITLTSTVGYEALMMNKPVYVFGNVFYECHPNCRKVLSYEELYSKLFDLTTDNNKSLNRCFIYAYTQIAYPGNIYYNISSNYADDYFTRPFINAINKRFFQERN
jgi:hypothetical protein